MATFTATANVVTWTSTDDPRVVFRFVASEAGGSGGGVTDHGALTGLSDDDHTQYALADGTRGTFAATTEGVIPVVWFYRSNVADLSTSTVIVPSVAYLPAGALVLFDGQSTSLENGLYEANGTGGVDVSSKVDIKVVGYANRPIHAQVVYDERSTVDSDFESYLPTRISDDTTHGWFMVETSDGSTYTIEEFRPGYESLVNLLGDWFAPAMDDYSISFSDMDGSGDYQLGLMHGIVVVDTTSGNCNLILGPHATMPRHCYIWHRAGSNDLTVENLSGDGNAFAYTVEPGEMVLILPDGASWHAWPVWRPQAKGDLQVGSADRTAVRLPVGSNGQVLTADSAEAAGVKWAAAGGASEPPIPRAVSSDYMIPYATIHDQGTQSTVADFIYFGCPFPVYEDITITAVQMRVTTAGSAGCDTRIGVFRLPADGDLAGTFTLVADLGTIDTDTAAPVTLTLSGLSTTLAAGSTYVFGHVSSHNVTFYKAEMQPATGAIGNTQLWTGGNEALVSINKAFTYGALDATYSGLTLTHHNDDGVRNYVAARWT